MPEAIRPWQHVLEALAGYMLLAEKLSGSDGDRFARSWNFGPADTDHLSVGDVAKYCANLWGSGARIELAPTNFQKETTALRLDATQARLELGWQPRWTALQALRKTLDWYQAWPAIAQDTQAIRQLTLAQIDDYTARP
jgi:CDP-glucose 4,6-dehydratase